MFAFHFNLASKINRLRNVSNLPTSGGEIYIETENGYFPCIEWNDRLLSVISQWISNTISMLDPSYKRQTVTNYFMNGPYFFIIQKIEKDIIKIRFVRHFGESEEVEEIPPEIIAFTDYCNALLHLGESIISDPDFQWFDKEQTRVNFRGSVAMLKAKL